MDLQQLKEAIDKEIGETKYSFPWATWGGSRLDQPFKVEHHYYLFTLTADEFQTPGVVEEKLKLEHRKFVEHMNSIGEGHYYICFGPTPCQLLTYNNGLGDMLWLRLGTADAVEVRMGSIGRFFKLDDMKPVDTNPKSFAQVQAEQK